MAEKPVPAWKKFLAQFQDILVILLLIATLISAGLWLYERDTALPYEAIAIFAVVLLNAIMGYIQQARAEEAMAALRQMSAAQANVIRDGTRQSIPATEVVPGDIIIIEEGNTVPADARVIQSTALQTAEAALTGESLPVLKDDASDCRRGRARRPRQYDLQRYSCCLRARACCSYSNWNADRDGTHCRNAQRRARRSYPATKRTSPRWQTTRACRCSLLPL